MKKLVYFLMLMLLFTSCKKENNARDFKGTYSGTFKTNIGGKIAVSDAELLLVGDDFKVTKGTKLASGTFKVDDTKSVTFADKNVWTADFDWNLILNGLYIYEAKGDSLILTKIIYSNPAWNTVPVSYQYRLKRSN
ncbi:MAG: hypothetical protein EOO91_08290 [Pedobacter sp.]|nr:MAG: hypothetical protein EOO91_08290 [Pedobacter sp.]